MAEYVVDISVKDPNGLTQQLINHSVEANNAKEAVTKLAEELK